MPIPANSESAKEPNQRNQTMSNKLIACFLVVSVAFIGISTLLSVAYAQPGHEPSDERNTTGAPGNAAPLLVAPVESRNSQTQTTLDGIKAQRTELRQRYGNNHSKVKSLDAQAERLQARLAAEAASAATHAKLGPKITELQQMVERAETDAQRAAVLCLNADSMDEESRHSVRLELQKAVREVFNFRMLLQNAQLDDAQAKIEASRQHLARRQTLADQIIERRAAELIEQVQPKSDSGSVYRSRDSSRSPVATVTDQLDGSESNRDQPHPDTEQSNSDRPSAAQQANPTESPAPTLVDREKPSKINGALSRYPTFEVASGLEGFYADIPELEGEWRLQKMYVDSTFTPVDGLPRIRIDSNEMQISGLRALFNDGEDLRVYLVKGKKNKLLVWVSNSQVKEFHLASFQITGSQLKIAIRKSMCDLGLAYRLDDFPAVKPAKNVFYFEYEAAVGLRSLNGPGFGDSEHYFSVQNTLQEGETILEHSAGDLRQIGDGKRIAGLQGRWTANKISLDGEEIALADSFKLGLQGTYSLQFGTSVQTHEYDKSVRMFAYPNRADSFIVIKSNGWDQPSGYIGSFSRQDGILRLAIQKPGRDSSPPPIEPGKGVLYAEFREQDALSDPVQLRFAGSETTPENGALHLFDARNSDENTTYRITRLECDTADGHFQQISRLETQITLKPGEVRRIEVPVGSGHTDWRVWVRGGPANIITSEKWTPIIGFFANSGKPSQDVSRKLSPLSIGLRKRPGVRDLLLRDDGTTTHERLAKVLDQEDDTRDARGQAFRFLNEVIAKNTDQAQQFVASPAVWRLLDMAIYPLLVVTSAPEIAECAVEGNTAIAMTKLVPLREIDAGSGKTHVRVVVKLQKTENEWLVVEVGLNDMASDSPAKSWPGDAVAPTTSHFPADGGSPPATSLQPYKLVLNEDRKTPLILMQRENDKAKPRTWKYWAMAEPVTELEGWWRAKAFYDSDGEPATIPENRDLISLDGFAINNFLSEKAPHGVYLLKHPEIAGAAIEFDTEDFAEPGMMRYSIEGDRLKIAIQDIPIHSPGRTKVVLDLKDPPVLQPGSGRIYVECQRIPDPLKLELIHTRIGEDRRSAVQRIGVTNVSRQVVRVKTRQQSRKSSRWVSSSDDGFSLAAGESKRIEVATLFPEDWQIKLLGFPGEEPHVEESYQPMVVGRLSHQDHDWPAGLSVDTRSTDPDSAVDAYPLSMSLNRTVQDSPAFEEAPAIIRSFRVSNHSDQAICVDGFVCENGTPVHGDLELITIPPSEFCEVTIDLPLDYDSRWRVILRGYALSPGDNSEKESTVGKPTIVASYSDPRIAEGEPPEQIEDRR